MRYLVVALALVALTACETQNAGTQTTPANAPASNVAPAADKTTPVPPPPATSKAKVVEQSAGVTFMDIRGFDEDLSSGLREKYREVVVDVPAKFSLNDIPDRMGAWLARIKESGGKVQAEPLPKPGQPQTRGILGALIDIGVAAYEHMAKERMYGTAEDYNVLMQYDQDTGQVKKVVFYHR